MTRVLQIRRGSTAQNDRFTGMPGEVTMDTDAKTIRIHDGQTLGGFALARADTPMADIEPFDITSVPDDFWKNLVPRFAFNVITVENIRINSSCTYLEHIVGDIDTPKIIQPFLVCVTAEAGYSTGDIVNAFGIGEFANPSPNIFVDSDGVHIIQMVGKQSFWVSHHDTGVPTTITDKNWTLSFRLYC